MNCSMLLVSYTMSQDIITSRGASRKVITYQGAKYRPIADTLRLSHEKQDSQNL